MRNEYAICLDCEYYPDFSGQDKYAHCKYENPSIPAAFVRHRIFLGHRQDVPNIQQVFVGGGKESNTPFFVCGAFVPSRGV